MTNDDQRETIEEILEHMDEAARLIRSLQSERLNAYCLAALEGRNGGWLGTFERDYIEEHRDALDGEDDD